MRSQVLMNLSNEFGKMMSLINSIIQDQECQILFIICHSDYFEIWRKQLRFCHYGLFIT